MAADPMGQLDGIDSNKINRKNLPGMKSLKAAQFSTSNKTPCKFVVVCFISARS